MKNLQLQVHQLSCARQEKVLFHNIGFELAAGQILLIEGPNGSGKTSLLRLLAGLSTPETGDVKWGNESIYDSRFAYQQHLHYLGHANGIRLGLTVQENLQWFAELDLAVMPTNYSEILSKLELTAIQHTIVSSLSAGQKRKLALAKILLFKKPLWILDEPFTALDVNMQHLLQNELGLHLQQGGLCILSSHQSFSLPQFEVQKLRLTPC